MDDQEPIDEIWVHSFLAGTVKNHGPNTEIRQQVLSVVSDELRTRRRDRRIGSFAIGLLLFAVAANMAVGQHESVRLARWHATPSSAPSRLANGPAYAVNKESKQPPSNYLAFTYPTAWPPAGQRKAMSDNEREITEWIRQLSETGKGI